MDNKIEKAAIKKAKQVKKKLGFTRVYYRVFEAVRINFPSISESELYKILNTKVFEITTNE